MSYKNKGNRKFFCDLDGVGADFAAGRDASGLPSSEFKLIPGVYRDLKPYPGFADNLLSLIADGWDVWIATKIPDDNPGAATEKLLWVNEHIPFMRKSTIITPNKGTLGNEMDFLLDDRPHKAHCMEFKGTLLTYGFENKYLTWGAVLAEMKRHKPDPDIVAEYEFRNTIIPARRIPDCGNNSMVNLDDIPEAIHMHDSYYPNIFAVGIQRYVLAEELVRFVKENMNA